MTFIGPTPKNIRLFGDKISAKEHVEKGGGPVIPGYQGHDQSMDKLLKECDRIGYPVICKATAGGGGRGLKVIRSRDEATEKIQSAQREAQKETAPSGRRGQCMDAFLREKPVFAGKPFFFLLVAATSQTRVLSLVPKRGLEPPRLSALVPETSASTNSATWASQETASITAKKRVCKQ